MRAGTAPGRMSHPADTGREDLSPIIEGTWCPVFPGSCSEAEHLFPCAQARPGLGRQGTDPQKLTQAREAWLARSCLSSPAAQD